MNYKDIKAVLHQKAIPQELESEVLVVCEKCMTDDKEVEVIVSTKTITVDVYDSDELLIDKFKFKIPM